MSNKILKNFKIVETPDNYIFVKISKEECQTIEDLLKKKEKEYVISNNEILDLRTIELIGAKEEIINYTKQFIPIIKQHKNSEYIGYGDSKRKEVSIQNEYFCCTHNFEKRNHFNNVIIHEDFKCSFNCICENLRADYLMIINNNDDVWKKFVE